MSLYLGDSGEIGLKSVRERTWPQVLRHRCTLQIGRWEWMSELTREMRSTWPVSAPPCIRNPHGDPPSRSTSLVVIFPTKPTTHTQHWRHGTQPHMALTGTATVEQGRRAHSALVDQQTDIFAACSSWGRPNDLDKPARKCTKSCWKSRPSTSTSNTGRCGARWAQVPPPSCLPPATDRHKHQP